MNCKFATVEGGIKCEICGTFLRGTLNPNKVVRNCSSPEYPSTIQMGKNLISSAMNFVKDGFKITDEEEHNRRLEICKGNQEKGIPTCPSYDKSQNRCIECGCFANFATAINSKHCPLNRW